MGTPLRVLIVEDSEDDALLLLRELQRRGYDPAWTRVDTAEAMSAALDEQSWDIILADYALPQFSGPAALELLQGKDLDLPFIVVSGTIGEEVAVASMRAGAHDYLLKGNLARLVPAIERELGDAEVRRERKRAEEALRESEARYRTLVERLPAITYTAALDESSTTLYVSPQIEQILGISPDEYRSDPDFWLEHLHEEDRARVIEEVSRSHETGQPFLSEYRMTSTDGRAVWIRDEATVVRDDTGNPLHLLGVMSDITERKRAEERIDHLNAVLRAIRGVNQLIVQERDRDRLLQQTCDILSSRGYRSAWIALLDEEGRFLTAGQAGRGDEFQSLVEMLQGGNFPECARRSLGEGGVVAFTEPTACGECPLGSVDTTWAGASVRLEFEERVYGVLTVYLPAHLARDEEEQHLAQEVADDLAYALHSLDLEAERQQAEEAQRESERHYRTLVENLPQRIFLKDRSSVYLSCNENYARDLGIEPGEIAGKTDYDFYPKDLADKYRADDKRLAESGETVDVEEPYVQDGEEVWVHSIKTPVRDESGNVVAILGIFWDITERKRAEERIEHLNAVLRAIRRVNQLIVTEKDRDTLLKGACENLIETRGYYNAWIALIDESGKLVTTTEAGLGKDFLPLVEDLKRGQLPHCASRALSEPGVLIIEDPPSTCGGCPLVGMYAGKAAMTCRLESDGNVYGLLTVSVAPDYAADEEGRSLFGEVADDLAYALRSLELDAERRRAEEALIRSAGQWQDTFDAAEDMIAIVDRDGRIVRANRAMEMAFKDRTVTGAFCYELFHGSDRPIEGCVTRAAIESGKSAHLEVCEEHLGGRWLDIAGSPIKDESGEVQQVVHVVRDITEQKRSQEALREREEHLRAIFEAAKDVSFIITDLAGTEAKILEFSPGAEHLFGYQREEVIGKHLAILHLPEEVANFPEATRALREGKSGLTGETVLVRKSGETFPALLTLYPLLDENGDLNAVLGVTIDITERERAEQERQLSFRRLQRIVEGAVRTMARIVEIRDPYTAGHQERVAALARAIAVELHLPEDQVAGLYMAGAIHDVGKISVPAEILSKPGRLTEPEFDMIKAHSFIGYDILSGIEFPWPIADIVLQHHERMDGSGYPKGLTGEDIRLEARILGVADVVEAMASHRPYRPARGLDVALEEISQNKGVLYDPQVADACLKIFAEKRFTLEQGDEGLKTP